MSQQQPSKTNSGSSPTPSTSTTTYSLNDLRDEVYDWAQRKGWWETRDDKNIPSKLALVHSEVSEALEDFRNGKMETYFTYTATEGAESVEWKRGLNDQLSVRHTGSVSQWHPVNPGDEHQTMLDLGWAAKPEGFPSELVDIIIRVVDLAGFLGIDLDHEVALKLAYNEKREYRHGGKKA